MAAEHRKLHAECIDDDNPPNSRLFIVCDKSITKEHIQTVFGEFGDIDDVRLVADRVTGDFKGIAYVKFAKTSQAAEALEALNGTSIMDHCRPLKVRVASSRSDGNKREPNEMERLLRLFVVVPKDANRSALQEHFGRFGDVADIMIVRDKKTGDSKGFAYVRYHKPLHAAIAFENCDKSFKPMFAQPKPLAPQNQWTADAELRGYASGTRVNDDPFPFSFYESDGGPYSDMVCLRVTASAGVTPQQLFKLMDIVPGLEYCDVHEPNFEFDSDTVSATAKYKSSQATLWALAKLNHFEYPPGSAISLNFPPFHSRLVMDGVDGNARATLTHTKSRPEMTYRTAALPQSLIKAAGVTVSRGFDAQEAVHCSARLPSPQLTAALDAAVERRLFIVCAPTVPPKHVLEDVFGRFEGLIEVYMLPRKTCGYVKYAVGESAERAIECLHGQELGGVHLKVMLAEPRHGTSGGAKRQKFELMS